MPEEQDLSIVKLGVISIAMVLVVAMTIIVLLIVDPEEADASYCYRIDTEDEYTCDPSFESEAEASCPPGQAFIGWHEIADIKGMPTLLEPVCIIPDNRITDCRGTGGVVTLAGWDSDEQYVGDIKCG